MFVDTSVIVAILSKEPDASVFSAKIQQAACLTSPVAILEAVMRLSTKFDLDPLLAEAEVEELLTQARIGVVEMDRETAKLAVHAFAAYGKGRGHPAKLNLGDCLSYACAKAQGVPLLYKGADFSHTDLAL